MAEQNVSGVVAEAGATQEFGAESAAVPSFAAATTAVEIAATHTPISMDFCMPRRVWASKS